VHQLENKVLDSVDARCNHEVSVMLLVLFKSVPRTAQISYGCCSHRSPRII